jgi:YbgC/YbaW family acyl-CoA thioester hydrolase
MIEGNAPCVRTELQVMFFDTDCGGVVHNIAYLRFIEVARTLLAEKLGLPLVKMAESKTYPVVVRTEIDYRRGAKLGDRLVVDGWLDRLERVRFWCAFRIVRPADETLIAECRQMLALIEMPEVKLLRLPQHWKQYRAEPQSRSGGFQAADQSLRRSRERGSLEPQGQNADRPQDSQELA